MVSGSMTSARRGRTVRRPAAVVIAVLAALALAAVESGAQEPAAGWTAPRTADGQPDLQGIWSNNTATPLERPTAFAGKESLTNEELADLQERAAALRDSEQAGNLLGDLLIQQVLEDPDFKEFDAGTGNYNSFWLAERQLDNRTSLIVDPPDGRIPAFTAAALERFGSRRPSGDGPEGPESLPLTERCITYGVPNLLAGYNSYFQIMQTADHMVFLQELIHDARIIPIDKPGDLDDSIRLWHGDSRGHWDGDTLVIETANYSNQSMLRGASRNTRVTERLRRVGPDTLEYVITFDDPDTWERPWTLMIPLKGSDEALFEYACHEGNYAMEGILAGARVQEAESR